MSVVRSTDPDSNAAAYKEASAINHAEGLKGHLLMIHGTGDDNVHYQGTERLINRLVELGKPFDTMVYPNRTHAIAEGPGTTPHVYQLIARQPESAVFALAMGVLAAFVAYGRWRLIPLQSATRSQAVVAA